MSRLRPRRRTQLKHGNTELSGPHVLSMRPQANAVGLAGGRCGGCSIAPTPGGIDAPDGAQFDGSDIDGG